MARAFLLSGVLVMAAFTPSKSMGQTPKLPDLISVSLESATCDLGDREHRPKSISVFNSQQVSDPRGTLVPLWLSATGSDAERWFDIHKLWESLPYHPVSMRPEYCKPWIEDGDAGVPILIATEDCNNAFATTLDKRAVVVLDASWLARISESVKSRLAVLGGEWACLDFATDSAGNKKSFKNNAGIPMHFERRDEQLAYGIDDEIKRLVFFHEMGHVILGHLSARKDVGSSVDREMEADAFAGYVHGLYAAMNRTNVAEWLAKTGGTAAWDEQLLLKNRQRIVREVWMVMYQEDDTTHPRFDKRVAAVGDGFQLGWKVGQALASPNSKEEGETMATKVRGILRSMRDGTRRTTTILSTDLLRP